MAIDAYRQKHYIENIAEQIARLNKEEHQALADVLVKKQIAPDLEFFLGVAKQERQTIGLESLSIPKRL